MAVGGDGMIDSTCNIPKHAMIFAAGLGTRMRPLTNVTPKPMVQVCGKPLIDYHLDALVGVGVEHVVVNVFHLAEQLEEHLAKRNDISITVIRESERLETGGGVLNALKYLPDDKPFFLMNSDVIITDGDSNISYFIRMAQGFDSAESDCLLLLHPIKSAVGYHGAGDFDLSSGGKVMFSVGAERPFVFAGVYMMHPRILVPYMQEFDSRSFSLKVLFEQHCGNDPKDIAGIIHEGGWFHVGTEADLQQVEEQLCVL